MTDAATVIEGFGFRHNRIQAAAQDYELAKADYLAACDVFDGTDARSVQRFNAAIDRRRAAWERYHFYKFGN